MRVAGIEREENDLQNATYVLIPGAWHGGWVWKDVATLFRQQCIAVTMPTLTGLGERSRSAQASISLSTHIEDIAAHVFMEGLSDVVLVGWSYGSFVAEGVAARLALQVRSIVYIDAIVPSSQRSVMDYASAESRAAVEELARQQLLLPPMSFETFGVSDQAIIDHVAPRLTGHPPLTFLEPLPSLDGTQHISRGYVHCTQTRIGAVSSSYANDARGKMDTITLDTGHHCMLSQPQQTFDSILRLSGLV